MISKSNNLYINRKLKTRGFQRDYNSQIPIYILGVIEPASQRPNSDWKWIVVGQTLNWGAKWSWNFTNFYPRKVDEIRNPMKPETSDSKLRSKRYTIFKISKNLSQNWVKLKNTTT